MSNSKIKFIVEEDFKTEDIDSRISTLHNLFIRVIKNCEFAKNTSFLDIPNPTKENPHNE